jgi:hypothetical protein
MRKGTVPKKGQGIKEFRGHVLNSFRKVEKG